MAGKIWNKGLVPEARSADLSVLPRGSWNGEAVAAGLEELGCICSWEEHPDGDILLAAHRGGHSEFTHALICGQEWVLSHNMAIEDGFYAKPIDPKHASVPLIASWLVQRGWIVDLPAEVDA